MRRLLRTWVLLAGLLAAIVPATTTALIAVEPDEILSDTRLEVRARNLSAGLRCLVCQNQSIDESNAPLARDLRLLVRERLKAGDSDTEIMDYVVARYGEFVLLSPRLTTATIVLWISPLLILIAALLMARGVWRRERGSGGQPSEKLSAQDEARLAKILDDPSKTN